MTLNGVLACSTQSVAALLFYLSIIGLLWHYGAPVFAWLKVYRTPVLIALMVGGMLMLSAETAFAMLVPEVCWQYNYWRWPCWIIEALWCPCVWPNDPPAT